MAPGQSTFQRLYQFMRNTRIVRLEKDKEHCIFNQKNCGPFLVGAAIPLAAMFIFCPVCVQQQKVIFHEGKK